MSSELQICEHRDLFSSVALIALGWWGDRTGLGIRRGRKEDWEFALKGKLGLHMYNF